MNPKNLFASIIAVALVALPCSGAPILINGDFETGNLNGWTTFVTTNGSLGTPTVTSFDTDGNGLPSPAATLKVGQVVFSEGNFAGGGIFQNFSTSFGLFNLSADFAVSNLSTSANASGGRFGLYVDGTLEGTWDLANVGPNAIVRSSLTHALLLSAGTHELRILVTRPYLTGEGPNGPTPFQYIDDVVVAPIPEPNATFLFVSGMLGIWVRSRIARDSM